MARKHLFALIPALLAIFSFTSTAATAQQASRQSGTPQIAFTVAMPKPHTHMLEVEVRLNANTGSAKSEQVLVMPVWTPGSYLIREFARNVQDFAAFDAAGHPLNWEKINKNSWRVKTNGATDWRAT